MDGKLRVCHVVNSVRDMSMPGDLAATQASFEEFNRVGILAWFDVEPFHNMDRVETNSLSDSNGLQITQAQYDKAKSVLSEYDIIHTHHPHSGFYGKLIAKRLGKPNVHTEHNNHTGFTRKGRVANGITNVLADAVVCVSESVRDSFFNWENMIVKSEKISVVNNGVDVERLEAAKEIGWSIYDMTDIDSGAVLVGSAGALTEQKAHEVLIEAVDQANAESEKPIELVISGGGELREDLEAQISNAEYSDRLHLLGFLEEREQVYKMMHEIDIYAMPSRWEGFCVAALEGMTLDNACIFSDIPEFKHPFNDPALFHPLDNSDMLADELVSIAADEKIRKQLAEKGRNAVVESYTLRQTAERYLSQYQTLL